jgi:hypothetical protein
MEHRDLNARTSKESFALLVTCQDMRKVTDLMKTGPWSAADNTYRVLIRPNTSCRKGESECLRKRMNKKMHVGFYNLDTLLSFKWATVDCLLHVQWWQTCYPREKLSNNKVITSVAANIATMVYLQMPWCLQILSPQNALQDCVLRKFYT